MLSLPWHVPTPPDRPAIGGSDAVAEIALGGGAGADACAGFGEEANLRIGDVNGVNAGESGAQDCIAVEQLDRPGPVLRLACLDFGRLLGNVHVNGHLLRVGPGNDLTQIIQWNSADTVGRDGDAREIRGIKTCRSVAQSLGVRNEIVGALRDETRLPRVRLSVPTALTYAVRCSAMRIPVARAALRTISPRRFGLSYGDPLGALCR